MNLVHRIELSVYEFHAKNLIGVCRVFYVFWVMFDTYIILPVSLHKCLSQIFIFSGSFRINKLLANTVECTEMLSILKFMSNGHRLSSQRQCTNSKLF